MLSNPLSMLPLPAPPGVANMMSTSDRAGSAVPSGDVAGEADQPSFARMLSDAAADEPPPQAQARRAASDETSRPARSFRNVGDRRASEGSQALEPVKVKDRTVTTEVGGQQPQGTAHTAVDGAVASLPEREAKSEGSETDDDLEVDASAEMVDWLQEQLQGRAPMHDEAAQSREPAPSLGASEAVKSKQGQTLADVPPDGDPMAMLAGEVIAGQGAGLAGVSNNATQIGNLAPAPTQAASGTVPGKNLDSIVGGVLSSPGKLTRGATRKDDTNASAESVPALRLRERSSATTEPGALGSDPALTKVVASDPGDRLPRSSRVNGPGEQGDAQAGKFPTIRSTVSEPSGLQVSSTTVAVVGSGAGQGFAAAGSASAGFMETSIDRRFDHPEFSPVLSARIATLVRDGVEHARVHLNPVEMGPVSLNLSMEGRQVRVDMTAEVLATRLVLEQSLPTLAGALREAGFTLSGGGVFQPGLDIRSASGTSDNLASGPANLHGTDGSAAGSNPSGQSGDGRQPRHAEADRPGNLHNVTASDLRSVDLQMGADGRVRVPDSPHLVDMFA